MVGRYGKEGGWGSGSFAGVSSLQGVGLRGAPREEKGKPTPF